MAFLSFDWSREVGASLLHFLDELEVVRCRTCDPQLVEAHTELAASVVVAGLSAGLSDASVAGAHSLSVHGAMSELLEKGILAPLVRCFDGEHEIVSSRELQYADLACAIVETEDGITGACSEGCDPGALFRFLKLAVTRAERLPRCFCEGAVDVLQPEMKQELFQIWVGRLISESTRLPSECDALCDFAAHLLETTSLQLGSFFDAGGLDVLLETACPATQLRMCTVMVRHLTAHPIRIHQLEGSGMTATTAEKVQSMLVGCVIGATVCEVSACVAELLCKDPILSAIIFSNDLLVRCVCARYVKTTALELDIGCAREVTLSRVVDASRAFLRGMTVAMGGAHDPDTRTVNDALSMYRRTVDLLQTEGLCASMSDVFCQWACRITDVGLQLLVLREAFHVMRSQRGGDVDASFDQSAASLFASLNMPKSLALPREHAVFFVCRAIVGRPCPSSATLLGRHVRRLIADVATQFRAQHRESRRMLQFALNMVDEYDVLCEATRSELVGALAAASGPTDHRLSSDFYCPISMQPFVFPVIASDTTTYELEYIVSYYLAKNGAMTSPTTRAPMELDLLYNRALANVMTLMHT